jgi:hypothetical protein
MRPSFGDRVRIRQTAVANSAGIAGLEGLIYGETVPSLSGAQVVGPCPGDFALNVYIKERDSDYWLAPEHVEFVDHAVGSEVGVGSKRLVRRADGEWDEQPGGPVRGKRSRGLIEWVRGLLGR